MGTFRVAIEIGDESRARWERMDALVDTGSTYAWVPRSILDRLGVTPIERVEFDTAGGAVIEREVGEVPVRLMGATHVSPVVFGDEGTSPLLGAVTLEIFHLAVDPVHERLIPVRALAM